MNIAVIGTNFISDAFSEAAERVDGVSVTAVYSRGRDTGEAFAKKHGIVKVYDGYSEMLGDADIDAVYVASPTFLHAEQSILAMRAGKHVLCEKMMAATLDEFYEMRTASEKYGRVLLEAMRPAHDPAMEIIKQTVKGLGKIKYAHLEFSQYSSRYDRFKAGIMTNAFDPRLKNTALSDIGIYPLHLALTLFGMPKNIGGSSEILHNGFEGEGNITLDYGDMTANVVYSKIRDGKVPSYIEGEHGRLYIDKISSTASLVLEDADGVRRKLDYLPEPNNMVHEIRAFRDMCGGAGGFFEYLLTCEKCQIIVDRVYRERGIDKYFG